MLRVDPPRSLVLMGADAATGKAPDPAQGEAELPDDHLGKVAIGRAWRWSKECAHDRPADLPPAPARRGPGPVAAPPLLGEFLDGGGEVV